MNDEDLWTTKHIATFLGLSRKHITDKVVKQKGFPKPRINTSRRNRKWPATEIRAWAQGESA